MLQGLAIATGVAILTSVFPASSRGRAIGIYVTGVYLGLSVGLTIGVVATMRLIGQMVSMVVVTVVFTLLLGQTPITGHNQIPFLHSVKTIFDIATLFCSAAVFLSMARGRRRKGWFFRTRLSSRRVARASARF